MIENEMRVTIYYQTWTDTYVGIIGKRTHDGKMYVAKPVEYVETKQYTLESKPTFEITKPIAQRLFQELWDQGFRPDNGEGNMGQIGALKDHLNDMRHLVFKGKAP